MLIVLTQTTETKIVLARLDFMMIKLNANSVIISVALVKIVLIIV